jgi:hypothetical protein
MFSNCWFRTDLIAPDRPWQRGLVGRTCQAKSLDVNYDLGKEMVRYSRSRIMVHNDRRMKGFVPLSVCELHRSFLPMKHKCSPGARVCGY